jgi:hypothetical protein
MIFDVLKASLKNNESKRSACSVSEPTALENLALQESRTLSWNGTLGEYSSFMISVSDHFTLWKRETKLKYRFMVTNLINIRLFYRIFKIGIGIWKYVPAEISDSKFRIFCTPSGYENRSSFWTCLLRRDGVHSRPG